MAKLSYLDKLKDPRWQRRRLEILNRDGFKCRSCCTEDKTLHVHHWRYEKGVEPWDAEDDDLITLCESCHEALHHIQSHPTLGIETFSCVMQLYDRLESETISKYLKECELAERDQIKDHDRF
jgi:hypothetical protein